MLVLEGGPGVGGGVLVLEGKGGVGVVLGVGFEGWVGCSLGWRVRGRGARGG